MKAEHYLLGALVSGVCIAFLVTFTLFNENIEVWYDTGFSKGYDQGVSEFVEFTNCVAARGCSERELVIDQCMHEHVLGSGGALK